MAHRNLLRNIAVLLLLLQAPLQAQEKGTFTHTIQRGETVYSIARTYQVSPDAILRLNPSANDGIKAGSTLVIPQQAQGTQKENFHTIQAGETLYQLTQKYGVDAETICQANPGLTADNFKAGMVIRIPGGAAQAVTASTPTVQPQAAVQKPQYKEMYKVKRRETIYSISRQFGLTEEELQEANPEMKEPGYKLRRGDIICIPYPKTAQTKPEPATTASPNTPSNTELIGRKDVPSPKRLVRMGVLLPFKGGTAENKKMVEFYRGVLMAVEHAKKSGISVEVFTYDSGESAGDLKSVLANHPLTGLDFIIGPLHNGQIKPLSDFCKKNQTRLVVPFSSQGEEVYQNPYYYAINPPKSFLISEAAHLTTQLFGKENLIMLDSRENDKDAADFTEAVNKRLLQNGNKMESFQLYDSELKWLETMNQNKTNVIIPNSPDIKVLNQLFPRLKDFAQKYPKYRFKLVGFPEWQTYTANHLENFYRFDTYAYSIFYRNPLNGQAEQFETDYQKTFHEPTIASWPRFAMLGFDTAYFFLKGISTYGDAFEQHLSQVSVQPYQHKFTFQRVSNWSGFINRNVEFIHYSPSHNIELIRLK